MVSIIAAIDSKRGLGKDNKLLWHIPADLKRFKNLTSKHTIIMGRKTFESIGRILPGRTNIVVTRNPSLYDISIYDALNLIVRGSIEEAIETAKDQEGAGEIFIIGGGQIYKEAIEKGLVDRLYLTLVEGDFGADTFFPEFSGFELMSEEEGFEGEYKYTFQIFNKL